MMEMVLLLVMLGCMKIVTGPWTQIGSDIDGEAASDLKVAFQYP
jgi:hypothetical protein